MATTFTCDSLVTKYLCGFWATVDDDGESGNRLPISPVTKERVVQEPGRHLMPSVAALALSSMAVGAAVKSEGPVTLKTTMFPGAPVIPLIIVTPPPEPVPAVVHAPQYPKARVKKVKISEGGRSPLGLRTNDSFCQRPGDIRSSARQDKENVKDLQGPARRPHARPILTPPRLKHIVIPSQVPTAPTPIIDSVKAAEPGSSVWEREKLIQLDAARVFSDAVRARRCSLPSPAPTPTAAAAADSVPALTRSASAPARLPVAERLRLAAVRCAPPAPPAPAPMPLLPLWGDDNVSFIVGEDDEEDEEEAEEETAVRKAALPRLPDTDQDYCCFDAVPEAQHTPTLSVSASTSSSSSPSSSSGSISSVLDDFEELFSSAAWLGLRQFSESKGVVSGQMQLEKGEKEDEDGFSGISGSEYDGEDYGSDQWSDVVSLDDYY